MELVRYVVPSLWPQPLRYEATQRETYPSALPFYQVTQLGNCIQNVFIKYS